MTQIKILKQLSKNYTNSTILSAEDLEKIEIVSTGIPTLDKSLGGGYARRMITEIFGENGCGKSLVSLLSIKEAQKRGEVCLLVDTEHTTNKDHLAKLGINVKDLLIIMPSCGEDALDAIIECVTKHGVTFIVLDSIANMFPASMHESSMSQNEVGSQARLMRKFTAQIIPLLYRHKAILIGVNQLRSNMSTYDGHTTSMNTPGGKKRTYDCFQRIQMLTPGRKDNKNVIKDGMIVKFKVYKNKAGPLDMKDECKVLREGGVDENFTTLTLGVASGILQEERGWYTYNGKKHREKDLPYEDIQKDIDKLEA